MDLNSKVLQWNCRSVIPVAPLLHRERVLQTYQFAAYQFEALKYTFGSDHYSLIITLPFQHETVRKRIRLKYRLLNADWNTFKSRMESKICCFPPVTPGNETFCAETFAGAFIEIANELFPMKKVGCGIPSPPWWDSECTEAARKRKEAEKLYFECSTDENFNKVTENIEVCKKMFKQKKI
uniref:Endonuclease/exonuclease/phosphatase domain-containing protein n=1 Tax=Pectinophora gossypiella TaxID=13191 RepID=A0A1E1W522_PECGO